MPTYKVPAIAKAVATKISYQFPTSPEGKIWCAVLTQCIYDLFVRGEYHGAVRHLNGEIPEAMICGVNNEWVRCVIKRSGLFDMARHNYLDRCKEAVK